MKIGRFLALGALAYGAYYAYKRREDIKEETRLNIIQERLKKYQGEDKE